MTAYFNEFDPKAAAWIRELIKRGLVADGVVDERSILDVEPTDLAGFTQCHFFAGVAGWSYALRLAGWPDDRPCWTGSPPCQPFSAAGRQLGKDDARHLAPHFISLVGACRPGVLFGEQVASAAVFGKAAKRTRKEIASPPPPEWAWLDDIQDRLEAARYAVGSSDIPAAGVGAAHIRQRTFYGAVRLADAEHAERWPVRQHGEDGRDRPDSGWEEAHGVAGARGEVCGLADSSSTGLQGHGGHGDGSREPGRVETRQDGSAGAQGPVGGLGNSGRPAGERDARGVPATEAREHGARFAVNGREPVGSEHAGASVGGVADANGGDASAEREQRGGQQRQQPQDGGPVDDGRPDATDSPWGVADWLFCRDGKWRPVEPGTFPLAHGVSARVGRLRGYGNAIVPQAAAEFIKAFDASTECLRLTEMSEMTTDNNQGVFG